MPELNNALTDVPGIKVGHAQVDAALTGVTVILTGDGATAGVDVRGGAPGTMGTDALRPMNSVQQVHAVVLTGGSAYGLASVSGVRNWLEAQGVGFAIGPARVPIVVGAVIFDLLFGDGSVRPDVAMGAQAAASATASDTRRGNVGAGLGATAGKIGGPATAVKTGLGMASRDLGHGLIVAAMVVVNAWGDVVDPHTGALLAAARDPQGTATFAGTLRLMQAGWLSSAANVASNTVIGCIATNARLTKEQCTRVAMMAHDGLGRAIRPAHTMYDGDTLFTVSNGNIAADVNLIGAFAAEVTAAAIVDAAHSADDAGGLPSMRSLRGAAT